MTQKRTITNDSGIKRLCYTLQLEGLQTRERSTNPQIQLYSRSYSIGLSFIELDKGPSSL